MRNISQRSLLQVRVPEADATAQAQSLRRFDTMTSASGQASLALASARRRSDALRRSVLAAAFSGRLSGPAGSSEVRDAAGA
jgi:type I restriction enzyme S subunit